jgi:hypothetical protein
MKSQSPASAGLFLGGEPYMKNHDPRQLELFSDGARAVAAAKRPKPPRPTETDLQARLDAARQRLHEIVILRMKTWIREETRRGLREAEDWRRGEVRLHFHVLERFREEQRRRRAEQSHLGKVK